MDFGNRDREVDKFDELEVRPIKGVTRREWGAAQAVGMPTPLQLPVPIVTVQFTGSKACTTKDKCIKAVRKLQRNHMLRGYRDIKYSFLIGADSHVYEGRGWNVVPEVNKMFKRAHGNSINIAFIWRHPEHVSSKLPDLNKIHVLLRKSVREEHLAPRPPPEMYHVLMDLLETGVKNNFLMLDHNLLNAE